MSTQRDALELTIAAGSLATDNRHAAVVALARTFTDQCDATGPEGPSTRLSDPYLSVLKDLYRALATAAPKATPSSTLSRLRSNGHQMAAVPSGRVAGTAT